MLVDGELDEQEQLDLEQHIAGCNMCKAVYDAFCAVSSPLGELEEPSEELKDKIMSGVANAEREKKKKRFMKIASYAACFAVIAFAGFNIMNLKPADPVLSENDYDASENAMCVGSTFDDGTSSSSASAALDIAAESVVFTDAVGKSYEITDPETLARINELLAPAENTQSAPDGDIDYSACFYCGDSCLSMDIYIEDEAVFADSGEGPVPVVCTADEFNELIQ